MLNIYLINVSSLETGDVDIYEKVFTSFGSATKEIDTVIQKYISDKKIEKISKIYTKDDFSLKDINKDSTFPVGGYCFKKKKSSVLIYKKMVVEGKLWNGSKVDKVGKIVINEINIPVTKKLIKLVKSISDIESESSELPPAPVIITPEAIKEVTKEELKVEVSEELSEEDDEEYNFVQPSAVTNFEHGRHVSFIGELKSKLHKRRKSLMESPVFEIKTKEVEPNQEKLAFIESLTSTKNRLKHITPPPSPVLGKVLDNMVVYTNPLYQPRDISTDSFSWDSSTELDDDSTSESVIIIPKIILPEDNNQSVEYFKTEEVISDEYSYLSDDFSTDEIMPEDMYGRDYDEDLEALINDILEEINSGRRNVYTPSKSNPEPEQPESTDYDHDYYYLEYYDGYINTSPVRRKYVPEYSNLSL